VTDVAPVKLVPVMMTLVPTGPVVGEKLVIDGETLKLLALVATPPVVVTVSGPVVAPVGTIASICVSVILNGTAAAVPLKLTIVAVASPTPEIMTSVVTGPLTGENPLIDGASTTVKLSALVTVPPGVVTAIGPVLAPLGTWAMISFALSSVMTVAATPLNVTADSFDRFVPVMVTFVPIGPIIGLKLPIVGARITVNVVALVAVPAGEITEINPVDAPTGTVAMISVADTTVKVTAGVPLKSTPVAVARLLPLICTLVPTGPLAGEKPVIVGGGVTVKLLGVSDADVAVPPAVVTDTRPVEAPAGTIAVIFMSVLTVKLAAVPLKLTAVAPLKPVPLMTTLVPTTPLVGLKLVIVGVTVKFVVLVAVPPAVVTAIGPVVAAAETMAVI